VARSTRIAIAIGAPLGAAVGIVVVAFAAGRVLNGGVGFVASGSGPASPAFVVGQAGIYLLVAVAGAVAGSLLGMIGYAVGHEADPDVARFGAGPLAVVGAVLGAAAGFGAFRALTGLLGSVTEGTVTLTVFRAIVIAVIAGAVTGGVTAGAVERWSRPEAFGFAGGAWPTRRVFLRDAAAAVGLPLLGLFVGAAAVYLLSKALLNTETDAALILFGGIAAVILGGAAVVAARGAKRPR